MIKLIYSDNGTPISDFQAQHFIDSAIASNNIDTTTVLHVANEPVLTAMVLALMNNKISEDQVQLFYFDTEIKFNPFYGLEEVKGFENIGTNLPMTEQILKIGFENIKKRNQSK